MAYSSVRSIEGPKPKVKKRKTPKATRTPTELGQATGEPSRSRPSRSTTPTTVTATLGGEGQRATERAAKKAKREARQRRRLARQLDPTRQPDLSRAERQARIRRIAERRDVTPTRAEQALREVRRAERPGSQVAERIAERAAESVREGGGSAPSATLGIAARETAAAADTALRTAGEVGTLALPIPALGKVKTVNSALRAVRSVGQKVPKPKAVPKPKPAPETIPKPPRQKTSLGKPAPRPKPEPTPGRDPITMAESPPRIPRTRPQVRAKVKAGYKAHRPSVVSKVGRQEKRRRRAAGLAHAGALAGPAAAIPAGVALTTGKAITEDPLKVAETSGKVLPSIAAGVIGTAADVGATGKRAVGKALGSGESWEDVLDPVEGELKAQEHYWKTIGDIAGGDTEAVKEELGVIPLVSGALTGFGVGKAVVGPRGAVTPKVPTKIAKKLDDPNPRVRDKAERDLNKFYEKNPSARQGHRGRKEAAVAAGGAAERERAVGKVEVPKEQIKRIGKLGRQKIGREKRLRMLDAFQVLTRRGYDLDNRPQTLERLKDYRASLRDPSEPLRRSAIDTRRVLDSLIEEIEDNPNLLKDPTLREAIESHRGLETARSAEMHRERIGEHAEGPDPELERARLMYVAQEEGIADPGDVRRAVEAGLAKRTRTETQKAKKLRAQKKTKVRVAERRHEAARRKTLRAKVTEGRYDERAAIAVAKRDRAILAKQPDYVAAVKELNAATYQLKQAKTDALRVATRKRIKRARANVKKVREDVYARAEQATSDLAGGRKADAVLAALNRRPVGALRSLERKAANVARAQRDEGKRAVEVEQTRKQDAGIRIAEAAAEDARRKLGQQPTAQFRRHEALLRKADELDGEGKLREADVTRRQALGELRKALETSNKDRDHFIEQTLSVIERKGYSQPIYQRELDVTRKGRLATLPDFAGAQIPASIKHREGILSEQGRIDESAAAFFHNVYGTRRSMEIRRMWRHFVTHDRYEIQGKSVFSGRELERMADEGRVPRGYARMPLQEFERTIKRGLWDDLANRTSDNAISALRHEVYDAKRDKGKKYILVDEAKLRELHNQMRPPTGLVKMARVAGYAQSALMLATSPAWVAFQMVASPFAALVAHPNPVRWAQVMKKMMVDWRKADPMDKAIFRSHFGGTDTDILMRRQAATGLEPDTSHNFSRAADFASKTPAGRALARVLQNLKAGGPLMAFNRKYEAYVRVATGLMEMDKIHHPPRVKRLIGSIARLEDTTRRHTAEVARLPFDQQISYYARHTDAENEISKGVRDTLGDWVSLSSRERALAAVTVFYPFLRFSLNWVFHAFPRRHPIKAAILLNLAAQNAQELEEFIGGQPSFFSKYGIAVMHTGPGGTPTKAIDTARFNPGANALVEALGKGDINAATLTRPFQPILGALKSTIEGYDPFTGEPTTVSPTESIATQILGLSPATRPLADKIKGERSEVQKFFDQLAGRSRSLGENLLPHPIVDLRAEAAAAAAGRLLDTPEVDDEAMTAAFDLAEQRIAAGEDPKKVANKIGRRLAEKEWTSQKAQDEFNAMLEAEGFEDDPVMEKVSSIIFGHLTPVQFGERPEKNKPKVTRKPGTYKIAGGGSGTETGDERTYVIK